MSIATVAPQPCPAPSSAAPSAATSATTGDYWALTKPEINFLIAIVTLAGFCLGLPVERHGFPFLLLMHTLLGTVLVSSGASALNQFIERNFDARMRRTARRPLAAGKLEPASALRFGLLLSFTGGVYLALAVNVLASLLAAVTLVTYLVLYTPLKRKTPWCTVAGAFSGAMPPLIGWAAAAGGLSAEAWTLYLMLFLWQFPHFMAIAWMYRDDYARAGYLVLPRGEYSGQFMSWQAMVPALALLPVSLVAGAGPVYRVLACITSAVYLYYSGRLAFERSNLAAKRLLIVSIIYAPLAFCLILLDKL
jgi:protoheme IX farnesyltransferase